MDKEKLDKLLRDYKFSGLSLEKIINGILTMESISLDSTKNKKNEVAFTDLANILVEYKFNYSSVTKTEIIASVVDWVTKNKDTLNSQFTFKMPSWGDET